MSIARKSGIARRRYFLLRLVRPADKMNEATWEHLP